MEECDDKKWFDATVLDRPDNPIGFMTWSEDITQYKYNIILPDGTKHSAKLFIDLQQIFDNNAFTNYLINRFNEL